MGIIEIFVVGLALSMDAFAVTLVNASSNTQNSKAFLQNLAIPIVFGLFQGLMPLIGYFAGSLAAEQIDTYSGIVCLLILAVIGAKMVWEGCKGLAASKLASKTASSGKNSHSDVENPAVTGLSSASNVPSQAALSSPSGAALLTIPVLLAQGLATSIDALVVGVSFLAAGANIAIAATIVAITTFVCCIAALAIGRRFGSLLGDKAQIIGGIVLIGIGLKSLFF